MRAVTYSKFGSASEALVVDEIDVPSVGPGEVLVCLRASGVIPLISKRVQVAAQA